MTYKGRYAIKQRNQTKPIYKICFCVRINFFMCVLLRGVENRRYIFFMYITRCVSFARIIPRRRIKLEKEAPNEPFLITHDSRLKEKVKKKKTTTRSGIASQPLSTFYPSQLALNSWSELWVTLSTTCSALRVKEGPFWFLTGKVTIAVAVLTSGRPLSSQGSVSLHPKCD